MEQKPADKLKQIAFEMKMGTITYEQAHTKAKPIIDEMNKRMRQVAREYGVPFKAVSFTGFTR